MSDIKKTDDDLYGGDLYGDLDLDEFDAKELEAELEPAPELDVDKPPAETAAAPAQPPVQANAGGSGFGQGQFGNNDNQHQQGAGGWNDQNQGQHQNDGMGDRIKPSDMPDEGKMFIGGLNWETSEERLRDYMAKFGDIDQCTIMRDPSGRSRGFAFLTYTSAESVKKVLAQPHQLDGKQIDPKRAIPRAEHERTAKVFVGGLAAGVTSESLKDFLGQFGQVMDATVMFDRETGRSKGFAFATFADEEAVGVAMAASGIELEGRQIEIKRAQPRGAGTLPNKYPTNNNNQMRNNQGGMGNMGGMNGGAGNGMMGMGGMPGMMGMGMPGMGMGMGGGFDPNAMAMMYSNMMKGGMGNMGGMSNNTPAFDPTAMASMYQNLMKSMQGMNAPAINPNMARNNMGGMMAGMPNMGMMGMGGMNMMGMGNMGGNNFNGQTSTNNNNNGPRPPAAPRGPAAMRGPGSGPSPAGAGSSSSGGYSGGAGAGGNGGPGAQRYSTQGSSRARPY